MAPPAEGAAATEESVFVQHPAEIVELVRASVPHERLVHLPDPGPVGDVEVGSGDVLFTTAMGGAHVGDLVGRGVGWIHVAGTGIDHFPTADAAGATITCSRGASAGPIAEYVLATMLAFEKDLPDAWQREPPRRWGQERRFGELAGKVLGLVGFGAIGQAVARRALAFDVDVVACRRSRAPAGIDGVRIAGLDEVLAAADHLVLALPDTPASRAIIDRRALALLRPGAHVVNVSRGTLIDQPALLDALDAGVVARASLDVTDPEPLPAGHPLYAHPGVRLTPHLSWSTPTTESQWVRAFVANLGRFRAGEPLRDVVDLDRGY